MGSPWGLPQLHATLVAVRVSCVDIFPHHVLSSSGFRSRWYSTGSRIAAQDLASSDPGVLSPEWGFLSAGPALGHLCGSFGSSRGPLRKVL